VFETYYVRPLRAEDVTRVYTVVYNVRPDIPVEFWREHIMAVLPYDSAHAHRQGACVLAGPNDFFYGLFTYRAVSPEKGGHILEVSDFCVTPLTGERAAAQRLTSHAEALAQGLGCDSFTITFLADETWYSSKEPEALPVEEAAMWARPVGMKLRR
jgi:hypothetical protein